MESPVLRGSTPSRRSVLPFGNGGLRQALFPANLDEILLQGHHRRDLAPKMTFQPWELRFLYNICYCPDVWVGELGRVHQREPTKFTASESLRNECGDIAAGITDEIKVDTRRGAIFVK